MMKLPKYVSVFTDRHGIPRFRFRRKGHQSQYLPALGSKDFDAAYAQCLGSDTSRPRISSTGVASIEIKRGTSYVYFIAGNQAIKIGVSKNLMPRLYRLRVSSPSKLRILAVVEGGDEVEAAYHAMFADLQISGEWFRRSPQLTAEIRALQRGERANLVSGLPTSPHRNIDNLRKDNDIPCGGWRPDRGTHNHARTRASNG